MGVPRSIGLVELDFHQVSCHRSDIHVAWRAVDGVTKLVNRIVPRSTRTRRGLAMRQDPRHFACHAGLLRHVQHPNRHPRLLPVSYVVRAVRSDATFERVGRVHAVVCDAREVSWKNRFTTFGHEWWDFVCTLQPPKQNVPSKMLVHAKVLPRCCVRGKQATMEEGKGMEMDVDVH